MSHTRAVAGNTVIQMAGKFAGNLLGVVTVAVMLRSLGPVGYGAFTTAVSFLQFFGILVDFGLTLTMTRMISDGRHDESRVASNILTLRLLSGAVFFGLAPIVCLAFPYSPEVKTAIAIGALSFFAMISSQTLTGIFQKHLATDRAAIADIAGRVTLLTGVLMAAVSHVGLLGYVAALVVGNAVQFAITLTYAGNFVRVRFAFDRAMWRAVIRESWPIGVSIAFNLIYLKGDVIILSLTRPQAEVGLYGAAYKVLDVVTVIPTIFMGLVMPLLASAWAAGRHEEFRRKLGKAFDALSIIALPLAFGTYFVAGDLMGFVGGEKFAASGPYLAVLMFAGAAVFWSTLFGYAVVALGLQRKMIFAYAADAALSLALYAYAIPKYGAIGAAWVTVFSETFIAIIVAVAVLTTVRHVPKMAVFAKAFAASALMAGVVWLASPLNVLARIVLGMIIYTILILLFGAVTKQTLLSFRKTASASI
jgi:O-antigen/teichoic acid export membrane protein